MAADLFGPNDIPVVYSYTGLDLTAEEGFLLSRIDGRTPVKSLLSMVSWDREKTLSLLESLLRKHAVNVDRKEVLERVFGKGEPEKPAPAAPSVKANGSRPKVVVDRTGIERVADLTEDRCVEILQWEEAVKEARTYYSMLDLPDGADIRAVKREYRRVALAFHPDKFFRKEIGSYRERLQATWKRVQEGYELLLDEEKKKAYDAGVVGSSGQSAAPPVAPKPGASPLPTSETGSVRAVPEAEPTKPMMESALERKLKQDIKAKIDKARTHFEQARLDLKEKRYQAADGNAKLALQFDPRNEEIKRWYESSRAELEEGIVGTLLRKGEMSDASSDRRATYEAFDHALTVFPENLDANLAMGLFLVRGAEKAEDYKRAKDCLQKVVAKRPRDLTALVHLARAMKALGMAKNAMRVLEQARELAPKDAKVAEEIKQLKRSL